MGEDQLFLLDAIMPQEQPLSEARPRIPSALRQPRSSSLSWPCVMARTRRGMAIWPTVGRVFEVRRDGQDSRRDQTGAEEISPQEIRTEADSRAAKLRNA